MAKTISPRRLKIVELLSKKGAGYSVEELMDLMNASQRSIYRDICDLKSQGFQFTKNSDGKYCIVDCKPDVDQDIELHFTPKELGIFKMVLQGLVESRHDGSNLQDRLAKVYKVNSAQMDGMDEDSRRYISHVKLLNQAIADKKTVCLKNYESGQSNRRKDYVCEPYGFTNNLEEVLVFNLEDAACHSMKISRIGEVELTDTAWAHEDAHRDHPIDLFRMGGGQETRIHLKLSLMAKNLLLEEIPRAGECLREEPDGWHFETSVYSMKGIGRFVIGLADQIEIVDGDPLKAYIAQFRRHLDRLAE